MPNMPQSSPSNLPRTPRSPQSPLLLSPSAEFGTSSSSALCQNLCYPDLDFQPCTLERFVILAEQPNFDFDLIDGVLYRRNDMANLQHNDIQSCLRVGLFKFNVNANQNDRIHVFSDEGIHGTKSNSHLRPDLCIALLRNVQEHFVAQKKVIIRDGDDGPGIEVAIEITSQNYEYDFTVKLQQYALWGIETYVVIHRRERQKSIKTVYVYTKPNKRGRTYGKVQTYSGNQVINAPYFFQLGIKACDIFDPPKVLADMMESPEKRAREQSKRADEERKRADKADAQARDERKRRHKADEQAREERKRADEADAQARDERKLRHKADARADKADELARKYKAIIDAQGYVLSPSGSPGASGSSAQSPGESRGSPGNSKKGESPNKNESPKKGGSRNKGDSSSPPTNRRRRN